MEIQQRPEDLADLMTRLKKTYGDISDSEVARKIGVAPATVNAWVHRKRGGKRGPNKETLRKIAAEFPKFSEDEIFAAAGRQTPGRLSPEGRERLLQLFEELTEDQMRMMTTQVQAVVESNRTTAP